MAVAPGLALSSGVTSVDKLRLTKVIVPGTRARSLLLMLLQLKKNISLSGLKEYINPFSHTRKWLKRRQKQDFQPLLPFFVGLPLSIPDLQG